MSTKEERQAKLAAARGDKDDVADDSEDIKQTREAANPEGDLEVELEPEKKERDDDDEPRLSRDDKKRQRGELRTKAEERDVFANLVEQERQTNTRLLAHLERLTTPRQTEEPKKDSLDTELEGVYAQLDAIGATARATKDMTPEMEESLTKKARLLRARETEIIAERAYKKAGGGREQQQLDPRQLVHQARLEDLRDEFRDIYTHDPMRNQKYPALKWAQGRFHQLVAEGNSEDLVTMKQAFREAQEKYGMRRRDASAGQRSKYTGQGRGTGGGGGDDRKVTLSPAAQRLRNAQFSHIKDKKARLQAMAKSKLKANARRDARE